MNGFKLESHVTPDGIVMMHLKGDGHVVAFASFHVDVTREFFASMLILKDKLNAAGLIDVPDTDIVPVPNEGTAWN